MKVQKHIDYRYAGFTLIELLIVISIIGILTSLLFANFISVKQRARDAQRKSDIRQLQAALELYRTDNGNYPANLNAIGCGATWSVNNITYMQKLPCDPLPVTYNGGQYYYNGTNGNASYTLAACLENGNDGDSADQNSDPSSGGASGNCSTSLYFVVNNPQ